MVLGARCSMQYCKQLLYCLRRATSFKATQAIPAARPAAAMGILLGTRSVTTQKINMAGVRK